MVTDGDIMSLAAGFTRHSLTCWTSSSQCLCQSNGSLPLSSTSRGQSTLPPPWTKGQRCG